MTKTAAIHIGHAKTGSTAIQNVLFRSRAELRSHGVLYPETGLEGAGHHALATTMTRRAKPPKRPLVRAMRDELARSEPDQVLISSESFAVLQVDRTDPAILIDLVEGYELHFGCVLREHGDYAQSLYAQYLKTGRTTDGPAEFVEQFTSIGQGGFLRWLEAYTAVVGHARFHSADYHLHRSRLLEWVMTDIGLERPDLVPIVTAAGQPSNERLGAQASAMLRHIAGENDIRLVGPMYFQLRTFLSEALPDDAPANFLSAEQIAHIRRVYEPEAEAIRNRWCSDFGSAVPTPSHDAPSSLELRADQIERTINVLRERVTSVPPELDAPADSSAPALVDQLHGLWQHHWHATRPEASPVSEPERGTSDKS